MNGGLAKIWKEIKSSDQQAIFKEVSDKVGLPAAAVEKDWWVVRTLELVFKTEVGAHTVFKGGTSLSKAWSLIDRFSEDIDLALDRKFLGFKVGENTDQRQNPDNGIGSLLSKVLSNLEATLLLQTFMLQQTVVLQLKFWCFKYAHKKLRHA